MKKELCIGLTIGMLAGALIVTNVPKARQLVEKGQKTVTEKVKGLMKKEEMQYEG